MSENFCVVYLIFLKGPIKIVTIDLTFPRPKVNPNNSKLSLIVWKGNNEKQAGAELCQAQVKLGLAKVEIFFHLIENKAVLDLK